MIEIKIKSLDKVEAPANDHYTVTATLEMFEDGVLVEERSVSVSGYRYEASTLKEAVKARLVDYGKEWKEQYLKAKEMAKELGNLDV